jgi:hypothetical protein
MLGLIINTNKLTVSIPFKYLKEVLDLLSSTPKRHCFKVSEAQKLTGNIVQLAEGANWVFHLLSHLYSSVAHVLSKNRKFLMESSHEFQDIVENLGTGAFSIHCTDLVRHTSLAMKQSEKRCTTPCTGIISTKKCAVTLNFSVISSNQIWILTGTFPLRTLFRIHHSL